MDKVVGIDYGSRVWVGWRGEKMDICSSINNKTSIFLKVKENARRQFTVDIGLWSFIKMVKIACNDTFEEYYFAIIIAKNMELDQISYHRSDSCIDSLDKSKG